MDPLYESLRAENTRESIVMEKGCDLLRHEACLDTARKNGNVWDRLLSSTLVKSAL